MKKPLVGKSLFLAAVVLLCVHSGPVHQVPAYAPDLRGPDRLLTNEYAHSNPTDTRAVRSSEWEVTSGSLYLREGAGWTGAPDAASPDLLSANGTGSSVFRATTRRADFLDTLVTLRVRNLGLTSDGRFGPDATDGVHVFLRWQSPEDLYVLSLNRRDGKVVVKRKSPGGTVNGGTYTTLGEAAYEVPYNTWQTFDITIENTAAGEVEISIGDGKRTLLRAVDSGEAAPAGLAAGAVGLRGDNCNFEFDDFRVSPLP
ncbi:hypothetical protein [Actinoplanes sp. NPDC051494]|uniref:hypothetical protein n=1 Tax=Actinoplanes sp. NPDC051494 TaxID=3363907 RepID=UPI0037ADAC2D